MLRNVETITQADWTTMVNHLAIELQWIDDIISCFMRRPEGVAHVTDRVTSCMSICGPAFVRAPAGRSSSTSGTGKNDAARLARFKNARRSLA